MTEAIDLDVNDDVTLEDTMIEDEVRLEVVGVDKNAFLAGFKAKAIAHFIWSMMASSRSDSIQVSLLLKPKNSSVTGSWRISTGVNLTASCFTIADSAALFLESPLRS